MSDDTPDPDDGTDATDDEPAVPGTDADTDAQDQDREATDYLYWGAFAVLLLLALIATVRFYLSASRAISIWIGPDFEPLFQSAFNLAVLLACGIGLSLLVRRAR